jgi:hypothetical protein
MEGRFNRIGSMFSRMGNILNIKETIWTRGTAITKCEFWGFCSDVTEAVTQRFGLNDPEVSTERIAFSILESIFISVCVIRLL